MTVFNSTNIDTTISDDLKQYFSVRKRYVDCIMNGDDSVSNVTDLLSAVEALTRMCPICVNYSGKSLTLRVNHQEIISISFIIIPIIEQREYNKRNGESAKTYVSFVAYNDGCASIIRFNSDETYYSRFVKKNSS